MSDKPTLGSAEHFFKIMERYELPGGFHFRGSSRLTVAAFPYRSKKERVEAVRRFLEKVGHPGDAKKEKVQKPAPQGQSGKLLWIVDECPGLAEGEDA